MASIPLINPLTKGAKKMATKSRRRRKTRSNVRPRYTARINPIRRRRRKRKATRGNAWYNNAAGHRKAAKKGWRRRRRNPARTRKGSNLYRVNRRRYNPIRKRRRTRRRNPNAMRSIQRTFSRKWLMQSLTISGGLISGYLGMPIIYRFIPDAQKTTVRPFLGLFHVLAGSLLFGFVKNKAVKEIGAIVAGTGVYDLIAYNIPDLGLPALPTSNLMIEKLIGAPAAPTPVSANFNTGRTPVSRIARGLSRSPMSANYETSRRRSLAANYQPQLMGANWGYNQGETDDPYAGVFDGF